MAGGQSRRMGARDKCLMRLGNKTILEHVIEMARPQVDLLVLNANGNPSRFHSFGLPVVGDAVFDSDKAVAGEKFAGPLAGILTGMKWTRKNAPACQWLATFPCDTPFIADDVVKRLLAVAQIPENRFACVQSNGRVHYALGLWPVSLCDQLEQALMVDGIRKTGDWVGQYSYGCADYSAVPFDPFLNINSPADLLAAQQLLRSDPEGSK